MIGILDWGIGGLWALKRLRERAPTADVIYLSDAGNEPYGLQSRARLRRSLQAAIGRLRTEGATRIVVACHSGSTAIPDLVDAHRVHGVIDPQAVPTDASTVLVIGGARTIRSGAWRRALAGRCRVIQRIAQPLSAAIEAGRTDHPETRTRLRHILAPGRSADVVVLGCTHYAALRDAIATEMPHACIVDPAIGVIEGLPLEEGQGQIRALTTGWPDRIEAVVGRALPELAGLRWERIAALT